MLKIRSGFVANSSSSSFIIHNHGEDISLAEFVVLAKHEILESMEFYEWEHHFDEVIESAAQRREVIESGEHEYAFGDEDGDLVGAILDYALRDGGDVGRVAWRFSESLR